MVQASDSSTNFKWLDIYQTLNGERAVLMTVSRFPIFVFLISAVLCMLGSAILHLFCCKSKRACDTLVRLDYAGICILIYGSTASVFTYGFYCQFFWANVYLISFGFICGAVFIISLFDFIHSHKYRHIKVFMYGGLGVTAALPCIHLLYNQAHKDIIPDAFVFDSETLWLLALEGLSYLGGLAVYATRFPEKFFPGKLDIFGHSHQIWHMCVFVGALCHYFISLNLFYDRSGIPCQTV